MAINATDTTVQLLIPLQIKQYEGTITHAELRPLYAPDIAKLKQLVQQLPRDADAAFRFYHMVRSVCNSGVKRFMLDGVLPIDNPQVIITKMQLIPVLDLAIRISFLTRGRSQIASSYKCTDCGKHTYFDLDPRYPMSNAEKFRRPMIDFAEHYTPTILESPLGPQTIEFPEPYHIVSYDSKHEADIKKILVEAPDIGDYTQYSKNDGFAVGEINAVYERILCINDLSAEETKKFKKDFSRDSIMKMPPHYYKDILKAIDPFKADAEFDYDCAHCGTANRGVTLEPTNLFEYLTN
jgi:DNA-directed RNA polymerase subunit RPC12/RpoP